LRGRGAEPHKGKKVVGTESGKPKRKKERFIFEDDKMSSVEK